MFFSTHKPLCGGKENEIAKIGGVNRTSVYFLELDSLNIFIISFEHPYILIASFRVLHSLQLMTRPESVQVGLVCLFTAPIGSYALVFTLGIFQNIVYEFKNFLNFQ